MIQYHNQVVRVKGIDETSAALINDLCSAQLLISKGDFKEIKTLPGIYIYIYQSKVIDPREVMLVFKDGQLLDRSIRRCA
ncbi:hypothetical protein [Spirosoma endophyticum]|uniref:Uncharacterized protein n=1 Tax=Spirosoma endophyticum TaxID=662367 RepID=A0A1I2IEE2_9BACT|nr:hypothetical protein [Spirosoma endophyticum]SFF40000.1 hypothetical protein SAMN05216167_1674 [Spirosoma endophyticum]